jgi:lysozyme
MTMFYSKAGMDITKLFEGCRLNAYQDSGGIWTIGYGHTFGVHEGMTCSQEQAEVWLWEDVRAAERAVNKFVTVPLTQHEFDALVDFTFNLGIGAFRDSTMLRLLNSGNHAAAADEFAKWDKCKGHVIAGLLKRRLEEKQEFQS